MLFRSTQVFLDETRRGKSEAEAYQAASDRYGMPITQLYDKREDAYKYTTKEGTKVNISPGRIVAVQMAEPGSYGYNVVSGVIDGVFRLAGDVLTTLVSLVVNSNTHVFQRGNSSVR